MPREVVIVEAVRSPMGRRAGVLSGIHPNNLGALVLNEVVKRAGIESSLVEDVVFGCVSQVGEQSANAARNVMLTADFPYETPATTIDRQCGSGQQAVHFAANLIQAETCDVTIGGGVESMSRVPMGVSITQGPGFPFQPELIQKYPLTSQGIAADKIAEKWGIERAEADEFALGSYEKARQARDEGRFAREMLKVDVKLEGLPATIDKDEGIWEAALDGRWDDVQW
jgi:acetyl-CoA acyltransferase